MRISRAEQIDTMLEKLKMRNTVVEAPLDDVLSSKKHLKEFPEANKLLNEVRTVKIKLNHQTILVISL